MAAQRVPPEANYIKPKRPRAKGVAWSGLGPANAGAGTPSQPNPEGRSGGRPTIAGDPRPSGKVGSPDKIHQCLFAILPLEICCHLSSCCLAPQAVQLQLGSVEGDEQRASDLQHCRKFLVAPPLGRRIP